MNAQQVELYERIRGFPLDGGDVASFGPRLRRENGWSAAFARRAVAEYRKFLFLATAAGHPVSPPDVVDQVWHLHLLYTRSYWDGLCGRVLPRALHHEPNSGSAGAGAKFADWYAKTLASYRAFFGQEPPADIWPAPGTPHPAHRHVDLDRHWIVPKVGWLGRAAGVAMLIAMLLLAGGCDGATRGSRHWTGGGDANPLNLPGPEFLILFAITFGLACVISLIVRRRAKAGDHDHASSGLRLDLDRYEIAYLNGGPVLAVNAALARLIDRRFLRVNVNESTLTPGPKVVPINLHPLEMELVSAVDPSGRPKHVRDVRRAAARVLAGIRERLTDEDAYLVMPDRAGPARTLGTLLALAVPAVAVLKILVGIDRGRPVGFLVAMCVAAAVIGLLCFARALHRTDRGDAALAHLRGRYERLRNTPVTTGDDALALGVALFGLTFLSGTEHEALARTLTPAGTMSGSSGSDGGCGGAGGGSSCGGGCGGGGCGGCGGCGS